MEVSRDTPPEGSDRLFARNLTIVFRSTIARLVYAHEWEQFAREAGVRVATL